MNKNIKSLIKILKSSGMTKIAEDIIRMAEDKSIGALYHGSPKKFDSFDKGKSNYRGLTYFTSSRSMAKAFAGGRGLDKGYIYSVSFTKPLNLFDPSNLENLELLRPIIKSLVNARFKDTLTGADFNPSGTIYLSGQEIVNPTDEQMVEYVMWKIKNKAWRTLEGEQIVEFLTNSGYDGLITREGGNDNVGIFDPALIKIENIEEIEVDPD
jgi:hypothetical protein